MAIVSNLEIRNLFNRHISIPTTSLSRTEKTKIRKRLQQIRQLSEYIWVLVAKSFTPTHVARLGGFDAYLRAIKAWAKTYPISKEEAESARATLQALDNQRDEIIQSKVQ
jgi:hypothetical protein